MKSKKNIIEISEKEIPSTEVIEPEIPTIPQEPIKQNWFLI